MIRLFDLDGTLIDSNQVWIDIDIAFAANHGLVFTEEYQYVVGHSIFPVAAQFTKDYYHLDMTPESIMAEWMDLARDAYAHHIPLKPGVLPFLQTCRRQGERMALLTACVPELCHLVLARHGLTDLFERVIFAQEMGMEKREPEVYLRSAALLGVPPAQCIFYEDAPGNCAAAQRAGMQVIGVYDPFYETHQEELRANCHRYIRSFRELL